MAGEPDSTVGIVFPADGFNDLRTGRRGGPSRRNMIVSVSKRILAGEPPDDFGRVIDGDHVDPGVRVNGHFAQALHYRDHPQDRTRHTAAPDAAAEHDAWPQDDHIQAALDE